jgi:multicomponent Na+:H+ antiporter subunit D
LLPYAVNYVPYTWAHVLTQLQLLLFSGLAFFVMLPYLKRTLTITLDTDWLWRRLLPATARGIESVFVAARTALAHHAAKMGSGVLAAISRQAGHDGRLARTWPTRSMALWVLVVLLGYLLLYYV